MGAELFHADTHDMTKLVAAFRNFKNQSASASDCDVCGQGANKRNVEALKILKTLIWILCFLVSTRYSLLNRTP
jgi:hypothetical protein